MIKLTAPGCIHGATMITLPAFILLSTLIVKPADSVSLTQLMPRKIEQGMASVGFNRGYGSIWWPPEAKPVRIGDRVFAHGLGMRANNSVTFRLDGRYQGFQGWVGVDAEVLNKPEASVAFKVIGDGQVPQDPGGVIHPGRGLRRHLVVGDVGGEFAAEIEDETVQSPFASGHVRSCVRD